MADAAAAQREARRRKILENSQNRLKLITGENTELNNDIVNNDSTRIQNRQIDETFLVNDTTKCVRENQSINEAPSFLPIEQLAQSTETNSNNRDVDELKTWSLSMYTPFSKRVFIVFLAIIIRLLFIFQMQFCVRDSIIYPFIIAELALQFLSKDSPTESVSPLMLTVLMFTNLPPVEINRCLRRLRILESVLQDFSLYFFTFLVVHLSLGFL